jgi:hypothetical protein
MATHQDARLQLIRVGMVVAQGVAQTDMPNFTKTHAGRNYIQLSIQALEHLAEPDHIGGVVAFVASDEARCIIGDTIRVVAARISELVPARMTVMAELPSGTRARRRRHPRPSSLVDTPACSCPPIARDQMSFGRSKDFQQGGCSPPHEPAP